MTLNKVKFFDYRPT